MAAAVDRPTEMPSKKRKRVSPGTDNDESLSGQQKRQKMNLNDNQPTYPTGMTLDERQMPYSIGLATVDEAPDLGINQLESLLTDPTQYAETYFDMPLFAIEHERLLKEAETRQIFSGDTNWLSRFVELEPLVVAFYSHRWVEQLHPQRLQKTLYPLFELLHDSVLPKVAEWCKGLTTKTATLSKPDTWYIQIRSRNMHTWCEEMRTELRKLYDSHGISHTNLSRLANTLGPDYNRLAKSYDEIIVKGTGIFASNVEETQTERFRQREAFLRYTLNLRTSDVGYLDLYRVYYTMELCCNIWDSLHFAFSVLVNAVLMDRLVHNPETTADARLEWFTLFANTRAMPCFARLTNYNLFQPNAMVNAIEEQNYVPATGKRFPVICPFQMASATTGKIDYNMLLHNKTNGTKRRSLNKASNVAEPDDDTMNIMGEEDSTYNAALLILSKALFTPLAQAPHFCSKTSITHLVQTRLTVVGEVFACVRRELASYAVNKLKADGAGHLPGVVITQTIKRANMLLADTPDIEEDEASAYHTSQTEPTEEAAVDVVDKMDTSSYRGGSNPRSKTDLQPVEGSTEGVISADETYDATIGKSDKSLQQAAAETLQDSAETQAETLYKEDALFFEQIETKPLTIDQIVSKCATVCTSTGNGIKLDDGDKDVMANLEAIYKNAANETAARSGALLMGEVGRILYFVLQAKKVISMSLEVMKLVAGDQQKVHSVSLPITKDTADQIKRMVDRISGNIKARMDDVITFIKSERSIAHLVQLVERYEGSKSLDLLLYEPESGEKIDPAKVPPPQHDQTYIHSSYIQMHNALSKFGEKLWLEDSGIIIDAANINMARVIRTSQYIIGSIYMCLEKTFHLSVCMPTFAEYMAGKTNQERSPRLQNSTPMDLSKTYLTAFFSTASSAEVGDNSFWEVPYAGTNTAAGDFIFVTPPKINVDQPGGIQTQEPIPTLNVNKATNVYKWYAKNAIEVANNEGAHLQNATSLENGASMLPGLLLSMLSPSFDLVSFSVSNDIEMKHFNVTKEDTKSKIKVLKGLPTRSPLQQTKLERIEKEYEDSRKRMPTFANRYVRRRNLNVLFRNHYTRQNPYFGAATNIPDPTKLKPQYEERNGNDKPMPQSGMLTRSAANQYSQATIQDGSEPFQLIRQGVQLFTDRFNERNLVLAFSSYQLQNSPLVSNNVTIPAAFSFTWSTSLTFIPEILRTCYGSSVRDWVDKAAQHPTEIFANRVIHLLTDNTTLVDGAQVMSGKVWMESGYALEGTQAGRYWNSMAKENPAIGVHLQAKYRDLRPLHRFMYTMYSQLGLFYSKIGSALVVRDMREALADGTVATATPLADPMMLNMNETAEITSGITPNVVEEALANNKTAELDNTDAVRGQMIHLFSTAISLGRSLWAMTTQVAALCQTHEKSDEVYKALFGSDYTRNSPVSIVGVPKANHAEYMKLPNSYEMTLTSMWNTEFYALMGLAPQLLVIDAYEGLQWLTQCFQFAGWVLAGTSIVVLVVYAKFGLYKSEIEYKASDEKVPRVIVWYNRAIKAIPFAAGMALVAIGGYVWYQLLSLAAAGIEEINEMLDSVIEKVGNIKEVASNLNPANLITKIGQVPSYISGLVQKIANSFSSNPPNAQMVMVASSSGTRPRTLPYNPNWNSRSAHQLGVQQDKHRIYLNALERVVSLALLTNWVRRRCSPFVYKMLLRLVSIAKLGLLAYNLHLVYEYFAVTLPLLIAQFPLFIPEAGQVIGLLALLGVVTPIVRSRMGL